MRLSEINEALDRRSFLKGTSALLGDWKQAFKMLASNYISAFGDLSRLYENLDGSAKGTINNFMGGLGNTNDPEGYLKKFTKNGIIYDTVIWDSLRDGIPPEEGETTANGVTRISDRLMRPSAPIESVMGKLAWLINRNVYGAAQALSGRSPGNFELISPGVMSKAVDYSIRKYGVDRFVSELSGMSKEGGISDGLFNAWKLALSNQQVSTFVGMTPETVKTAAETGRGLVQMVDKGLLDKEHAGHWRDTLRSRLNAKKRRQKERTQKERDKKEQEQEREQEREQTKKPEVYEPRSDDYIYGNPMHQPFESRLRAILTCIL